MVLTVDADWFQLRSFITGNQIIISDQFVSPVCSSVMNFPIVTTSALFCDSMIAEIAQIGDVRKIPCREIFSAGDSCLYGPCVLIWNCFVISAVHCSIIDGYTHEYINQLIHYDSLQQIQSLSSLIAHSQNSKKREDYNTELHPIC